MKKSNLFLVSFNETIDYDAKIVKKLGAKTIHCIYLVDKSKTFHICDVTAKYELRFLFSVTNNALTEKRHDLLRQCDAAQDTYRYLSCNSVDKLESVDNVFGIEPKACQYKFDMDFEYSNEAEYKEGIESAIDEANGNGYFM